MTGMRLLALILAVTLTGPSVGALVCDWTCAPQHAAAATAGSTCHDDPGPSQTPAFAAGHECHELPTLTPSILTSGPQVVDTPLTAETAAHATAMVQASFVTRRPDRSHAPPPTHIVPLRI